jgi:hypothetical protein
MVQSGQLWRPNTDGLTSKALTDRSNMVEISRPRRALEARSRDRGALRGGVKAEAGTT